MGLRRSGKSSIQKVVFQKMSPNETLFLETTSKIVKTGVFVPFVVHKVMAVLPLF
jgi:Ras-related GTP-binding protein C/D